MRELNKFEDYSRYRIDCSCSSPDHALDIEIDQQDAKFIMATFQEHICSRTMSRIRRVAAAINILLGHELCLREICIDREEALEIVKVLQDATTRKSE